MEELKIVAFQAVTTVVQSDNPGAPFSYMAVFTLDDRGRLWINEGHLSEGGFESWKGPEEFCGTSE